MYRTKKNLILYKILYIFDKIICTLKLLEHQRHTLIKLCSKFPKIEPAKDNTISNFNGFIFYTVKMNTLYLINKIVATDYKQYY